MSAVRPALIYLFFLLSLVVLFGLLAGGIRRFQHDNLLSFDQSAMIVAGLGLTDLCLSTEARYTRHPAVSDPIVPFMDHPGAIEHFPSGTFWTPVPAK